MRYLKYQDTIVIKRSTAELKSSNIENKSLIFPEIIIGSI